MRMQQIRKMLDAFQKQVGDGNVRAAFLDDESETFTIKGFTLNDDGTYTLLLKPKTPTPPKDEVK